MRVPNRCCYLNYLTDARQEVMKGLRNHETIYVPVSRSAPAVYIRSTDGQ